MSQSMYNDDKDNDKDAKAITIPLVFSENSLARNRNPSLHAEGNGGTRDGYKGRLHHNTTLSKLLKLLLIAVRQLELKKRCLHMELCKSFSRKKFNQI